jgi:ribosome-associated protein
MSSLVKANEMVKIAYEAILDRKADDVRIIDISGVSTIADYFIICDGSNSQQVQAIQANVDEQLGRAGFMPLRVEGVRSASWILMDYGDVVIHIFSKEDRLFYDLERIWKDGKELSVDDIENL